MGEYHALRALLGIMQLGIVSILLKKDIGYLWRFGILMFASAVSHLAPSYPMSPGWQTYIQMPSYVLLFGLTLDATLEFFAYLKRRTFIEERAALLTFAALAGLIPVWVFWWGQVDDWYQTFMLARQYAMLWLTAAYLTAWVWLRAVRPVHTELHLADHGEFWGFWLIAATLHASTTKWGILWRFAEWAGADTIWRGLGDALFATQICVCAGFMFNLWRWRPAAEDVAPTAEPDPQAPASYLLRRLLHP